LKNIRPINIPGVADERARLAVFRANKNSEEIAALKAELSDAEILLAAAQRWNWQLIHEAAE